MGADSPVSNAEAPWAQFDADAYFEHYYGDPHPDDDLVASRAATALRRHAQGRTDLDVLDVGTGANLIPLLAALAVARHLTAWEYAERNIAWLRAELQRHQLRPQWQRFWRQMGDGDDALVPELLRARVTVQQGSIFDLPLRRFDAATMFFCAESITHHESEFERACRCFAHSVRAGGLLVGAFLAQSAGYEVNGVRYPAVPVTPDRLRAVFAPHAAQITVEVIGGAESEVRSGYSGMILLTAVSA